MNEKHGYPERIIPDETTSGIIAIHLKRYDFARSFAQGKRVLDVACGVGYGSRYLAETAASVTGVDLDLGAISYAKTRYADLANITFVEGDALNLPFDNGHFDVICSFETIEHVPDAARFLNEVQRLLVPNGIFIISTPATQHSTLKPKNPHHVQEWSPRDFDALLRTHFPHVQLYSQIRRSTLIATLIKQLDVFKLRAHLPISLTRQIAANVGVRTMGDVNLEDIEINSGIIHSASEIVAVCFMEDDLGNSKR